MKTVVSYAYYENNRTMYNLDFFMQVGIQQDPNILYIIVVNGHTCSVQLLDYDNVIILRKDNKGYDFGAHMASINYLIDLYGNINDIPYDNFIFLNCGVIGPFLPSYYPSNMHWSTIFTSKLNDKIKLVGTSLVCFEYKGLTGQGPHVEGFCFCLDKIGLDIVFGMNLVFVEHETKHDAIINGEYGLSKAIINAGYSLDTLLYKYQNIDWANKDNWINNNGYGFPSRNNTYDGITMHPFETVFHKWFWAGHQPVNFNYVVKYRKWKLEDINKDKILHATFGIGEYMINVTNIIYKYFVNDNMVVIPVNYYEHDELKKISRSLGSEMCHLYLSFKGVTYKIPHIINEDMNLYIDVGIFDVRAKYGCMDFNVDVTHKFINTFLKNDKIIIPKKYGFNKIFCDVCPKKIKHLFIWIRDKPYIINETNPDVMIDLKKIDI